ncbi:MAG: hypothetical protein AAFQ87_13260 [Bacteroidota bacterium]
MGDQFDRISYRWKGWDYRQAAAYFVTICTHQKIRYFGEIIFPGGGAQGGAQNFAPLRQPYLRSSLMGAIAYKYWRMIPQKYPFVRLGEFIIMPDHVHGILNFERDDLSDWKPSQFGPQSQNLGAVIRGYKAGVKSFATKHGIEFSWQRNYYDRIIRDERSYQMISQYIRDNPKNWRG